MHAINLTNICNLVSTCLILHNMGVADRIMQDIHKDYIPANAPPETVADTWDATIFPAGIVINTQHNITRPTIDKHWQIQLPISGMGNIERSSRVTAPTDYINVQIC
jgi:hypothetical protein